MIFFFLNQFLPLKPCRRLFLKSQICDQTRLTTEPCWPGRFSQLVVGSLVGSLQGPNPPVGVENQTEGSVFIPNDRSQTTKAIKWINMRYDSMICYRSYYLSYVNVSHLVVCIQLSPLLPLESRLFVPLPFNRGYSMISLLSGTKVSMSLAPCYKRGHSLITQGNGCTCAVDRYRLNFIRL